MRLEYRLVERQNIFNKNKRFFPQVKMIKFGVFGFWRKIAKHYDGFGLYPESDYKYPKTEKEAKEVCESFDKWSLVENNTVNIIHPMNYLRH